VELRLTQQEAELAARALASYRSSGTATDRDREACDRLVDRLRQLLPPDAAPPRVDPAQAHAWLRVVPGLWLVFGGLLVQGLYALVSASLLIAAALQPPQPGSANDVDLITPLVVNSISLVGALLILVGRVRCCDCPKGPARLLAQKAVGIFIAANVLSLIILFVGLYATLTQGVELGGVLALLAVAALVVVVVGEYFFCAFLHEAAVQIRDEGLRASVASAGGYAIGLVLAALPVWLFIALIMASGDREFPATPPEVKTARIIAAGLIAFNAVAVVGMALYAGLVRRGITGLNRAADESEKAARVIPLAERLSEAPRPAVADDDFERFFREDAGRG